MTGTALHMDSAAQRFQDTDDGGKPQPGALPTCFVVKKGSNI